MGRLLYLATLLLASAPETSLLEKSLRPQGLQELEANLAPLSELPTTYVEAELSPPHLSGKLRLVVRNREQQAWSEIVLRAYPNVMKGASLHVDDVRVDGAPARARQHGSVIEIAAPLAPGKSQAISLSFEGTLTTIEPGVDDPLAQISPGLFALQGRPRTEDAGYGTFAVSGQGATLVDWYPQLAARAHGSWDREEISPTGDASHADPGNAIVSLTVPKGWRVEGAGTALGQHASASEKEVAAFAAAGIRGALGLVASEDYAQETRDVDGIQLRIASLHANGSALIECGSAALHSLEKRFGPYPWSSLTLAEVPLVGGAGGVELPALSLIAKSLSGAGGMFEFTCYHEVAHQWWQALVGSDPRRAPWVDEALAQFSAELITEDVRGKEAARNASDTFIALNYQGMRLAGVKDGKVAQPAGAFRSPLQYAGIVYGKAPLFYEEARKQIGDEAFDGICRAYRQQWAFREAGPDAWAQSAKRLGHDLGALERHWFHELHGDSDIPPPDPMALLQALGNGTASGLAAMIKALDAQLGATDPQQLREQMKQLEKLMPELQQLLENQ